MALKSTLGFGMMRLPVKACEICRRIWRICSEASSQIHSSADHLNCAVLPKDLCINYSYIMLV